MTTVMSNFNSIKNRLINEQFTWLITGVAGFIGSNLLEELLNLNQKVVGLDNFRTGFKSNIESVRSSVDQKLWKNFTFYEGDITDISVCQNACKNIDYVLHQAALGSVPRSINDPISTNDSNINGFLNILIACRDNNIKQLVYAASSSTYGDHTALPKKEDNIGKPLSPYAVTKYVNELYADVFHKNYNLCSRGLRYFNVFGRRQDLNGAYAAVIPIWIKAIMKNDDVYINGDGTTSRDFTYIDNAIQANILAALNNSDQQHNVFNVAVGERTSLNEMFALLVKIFSDHNFQYKKEVIYRDYRSGDVLHFQADISKSKEILNYMPSHNFYDGLTRTVLWYINN